MVTTTTPQLSPVNQQIPSEVWASLESNDRALLKDVKATHTPDSRKIDVKFLLRIIDNILLPATSAIPSGTQDEKASFENISQPDSIVKLQALAPVLNQVSRELLPYSNFNVTAIVREDNKPILSPFEMKMAYKCFGGGDAQAKTMVVLKTLSNYSWDAKVVLTVVAFAMSYGEFFLLTPHIRNPSLPQSTDLLKQLRDITQYAQISKPKFDAIIKLVKVIVDLTKTIVEFNELLSSDISLATDEPPMSIAMAYIPKAAYWTILSVVVCAWNIITLNGCEESATESWSLSSIVKEGNKVQTMLKNQLIICQEHIDEKSEIAYRDLKRIFNVRHQDNGEILKTLFSAKDGRQFLLDGTYDKQIDIEELRGKNVLLLISDLDITTEMIQPVAMWYQESQEKPEIAYKIVWLPVLDVSTSWDQKAFGKYKELSSLMPWYIVQKPSRIKPEVIKYIKKEWHFGNKMILVPIDPQGKVQSLNALDMLLIWGNSAFPFAKEKEEALWKIPSLTLELLFSSTDSTISQWTNEGKIVCVYGGEDIEWIREFTRATNAAKETAGIGLKMLYVGKRSIAMKQKMKITDTIEKEKLSDYWRSIWRFWAKLEGILYLKMQQGKNLKNDEIMREVTTLLSYDDSDKGWAIFCDGSSKMTKAKGDVALTSMKQFDEWWNNVDVDKEKGFVSALSNYIQQSSTVQYCYQIILSGNRWEIPSKVLSSEGCDCYMEKCFMYSCYAEPS